MAKILEYFKDINFMYNDCSVYDTLAQMLSEFEADIRAKAIDEFAEKLNMQFADWQLTETDYDVRYTIGSVISEVDEIAEQLKGE